MPIIYGIIALVFLVFILKILSVSVGFIMKLVWNGISGLIALLIFNLIGGLIGLQIEITVLSAIIAGIFGIPGIIALLLFS